MTSKKKGRGCCGPAKIASRLRFDPVSALELTAEDVAFGAAMHKYLAKYKLVMPTCGEVLDVLMDLGYANAEKDFGKCVQDFTMAVHAYKKRQRRPFPTWSEVLGIAKDLGWKEAGHA